MLEGHVQGVAEDRFTEHTCSHAFEKSEAAVHFNTQENGHREVAVEFGGYCVL